MINGSVQIGIASVAIGIGGFLLASIL